MQLRPGAKWTNPTLKEASGNHDAQSRRRTGSIHHQDFVPDVSGLTRVEEHAVGDRTQVDGSDLLFGFPRALRLGYALDLRSPGRRTSPVRWLRSSDSFADLPTSAVGQTRSVITATSPPSVRHCTDLQANETFAGLLQAARDP
jgi:hypothetical protein